MHSFNIQGVPKTTNVLSMLCRYGRLATWRRWSPCDVGEATERFQNELWRRWSDGKVGERALLYLRPTFTSLHLRHKLILQPFRRFTYVTAHSPTLSLLHLRHNSLYNLSITSPTSQLILQPFRRSTYVTAHSPTLTFLHLRHNSFSNPSVALPTSQLILLPFRYFTYVTVHSPTLLSLLLRHKLFTYVTWRAAHPVQDKIFSLNSSQQTAWRLHFPF